MKIKIILVLFLFSISFHSWGKSKVTTFLDGLHGNISSQWDNWNNSVDSFFANEIYEDEVSDSHIRFDFTVRAIEREAVTYDMGFKFKVDFPNASKRVKLIIEEDRNRYVNNDLEINRNLSTSENAENIEDSINNNNISAALRFTSIESKKWKMYTDAGLRFNLPLNPFTKMRVRRKILFTEWSIFLIQNFTYYYQEHFKSSSEFQAHHLINDEFKFNFSSTISWLSETETFNLSHTFTLYQRVSDRSALSYSVSTHAITVPSIFYDMFGLSLGFRRQLHQNWLFMQLSYGTNFSKLNRYRATHFTTLKLQMVF